MINVRRCLFYLTERKSGPYYCGLFFVLFINLLPRISYAQKSSVDSAYEKLEELLLPRNENYIYSYSKRDSMLFKGIAKEMRYHDFRQMGIKLWFKYPSDVRRYNWFERTVNFGSYYNHNWLNVEEGMRIFLDRKTTVSQYSILLNWKDINEWEALYPEMLAEYKLYREKTHSMEYYNLLLAKNLRSFLKLSLNKEYRRNRKMDFSDLNRYFMPVAERVLYYQIDSTSELFFSYVELRTVMNYFLVSNFREYDLSESDIKYFFKSMEKHPIPIIRRWANTQGKIFLLLSKQEEFNFKHKAIDGTDLDFHKMRNKVVLFDFWSIRCSTCIDKMHFIKKIYDKYKDKGFLVVSACLNDETVTSKVKGIIRKVGAEWPTALIGTSTQENSLGFEIWKKYGFYGVPQLLLFDKKGQFVLLNDVLLHGDFEPIIKQLIEENI